MSDLKSTNVTWHEGTVTRAEREALLKQAGATVWFTGLSGSGKSALVQHFLDNLSDGNEAVVLAGRCYEQESVPYKALDSLIDSLSRFLSNLPAA